MSTILFPSGPLIQAPRTCHSAGTSQSKIFVPVGTSVTVSGMCWPMAASVSRTPCPVMLRSMG